MAGMVILMADRKYHDGPGEEALADLFVFGPLVALLSGVVVGSVALLGQLAMWVHETAAQVVSKAPQTFEQHPGLAIGVVAAVVMSTYAILYAYRVYDWNTDDESEEDDEDRGSDSTERDEFECQVCGKEFDHEKTRDTHESISHGDGQ